MFQGVFQNILRLAVVDTVDYNAQKCFVKFLDREDNKLEPVFLCHPWAGTDSGVYVHPEENSLVLVGWSYREKPYIVCSVPNAAFARDLNDGRFTSNVPVNFSGYPYLRAGEIALSGKQGSTIKLDEEGSIRIRFGSSKVILDSDNKALSVANESTKITDSSILYNGIIQRDLRLTATETEVTEDKYSSLSFARVMSEIARDPELSPVAVTSNLSKPTEAIRNPALTEQKQIIYEFAQPHAVDIVSREMELQGEDQNRSFLDQSNLRIANRFDCLSLNVDNPNLLIEQISGTLVDIYGNLLDLNRNVVKVPRVPTPKSKERISFLNSLLRRTVKYHWEMNPKKNQYGQVAVDVLDGDDIKNGHTHSRWSLDIDGEGLTKLNIPASSNIGNIPFLTRYVNNHLKNKKRNNDFKSDTKTDINHLAFGDLQGKGIGISNSYAPSSLNSGVIKYRTAFHDIIDTAQLALNKPALASNINNDIPESLQQKPKGNAGGRSLHANLDGSMELNIGRDVIDGKSIVLDTSGGIVSRIGKTKKTSNEASIISQLDGSIYIQVGGDTVDPDPQTQDPSVNLVVKGSKGTDEIHIGKDFIKLTSASGGKNIIIESSRHIVLKAAGTILLQGSTVGVHGTFDDNGEHPIPARLIKQEGKPI